MQPFPSDGVSGDVCRMFGYFGSLNDEELLLFIFKSILFIDYTPLKQECQLPFWLFLIGGFALLKDITAVFTGFQIQEIGFDKALEVRSSDKMNALFETINAADLFAGIPIVCRFTTFPGD